MHLFGHNLDHDYCSNSLVKGSGTPYHFSVRKRIGILSTGTIPLLWTHFGLIGCAGRGSSRDLATISHVERVTDVSAHSPKILWLVSPPQRGVTEGGIGEWVSLAGCRAPDHPPTSVDSAYV